MMMLVKCSCGIRKCGWDERVGERERNKKRVMVGVVVVVGVVG